MTSVITQSSTSTRRVDVVMGTVLDIEIVHCDMDARERETLIDDVVARLRQIESTFSTYNPSSEISRIGRGELSLEDASSDVAYILDLCETLKRTTNGVFDIYAAGALEPARRMQESDLPGARPLEPSGAVKGWAIEQAVEMLRMSGLRDFCVNIGGDLYASGERSPGHGWRIGLQHPTERKKVMAVLEVSDLAVATSGLYERGNHIVIPPAIAAEGLVSMTVIGADITLTDAYATAAFAMGIDGISWVSDLAGFEVFAVNEHEVTIFSSGLSDILTD
jgi:thiamine biosynthesis lipoprotein